MNETAYDMQHSIFKLDQNHTSFFGNGEVQIRLFLAAWEEAIAAYEDLLGHGISDRDRELANDARYRRLLAAGQRLQWIGGSEAVKSSAQIIGRSTPGGSPSDFDRLWCGLFA